MKYHRNSSIVSARNEPDLGKRAQLVADAYRQLGPIYSRDDEFAAILDTLPEASRLAFLNGCNIGSCDTMSLQLAALMSLAGVPATVISGPKANVLNRYVRPGHAQVRCFTPAPASTKNEAATSTIVPLTSRAS